MATYGGDEISALVLDTGYCWTRAGYAGEDTPKAVFPSLAGVLPSSASAPPTDAEGDTSMTASTPQQQQKQYIFGDGDITCWRPNMEIQQVVGRDGLVKDWDALEKMWEYAIKGRLRVRAEEHPLLVVEPAWNPREAREKMCEIAFESLNVPAFYLARDAVCTAFATGRSTALVLSSGGGVTSAVPVYDGYVLQRGMQRQIVAGEFVSDQILQGLEADGVKVVPQYLVAKKHPVEPGQPANAVLKDRPNTTESFHKYMKMRTIHEFKESVCQVAEMPYDENVISARPQRPYEFPDGYNMNVGSERYRVPELLFQPQQYIRKPVVGFTDEETRSVESAVGIPQLIFNSALSCDIDMRPSLLSNIVVTGGNTLFPGFTERINQDLYNLAFGQKFKIHAPGNTVERKYSGWLGGSILASMGTFHQLWVSRKEYEESGASIVEKKCL
ncbi:uncharacterized protein VTP21DRAFT_6337 [Calcarisporiella thermophila]|uniref:uncharacterized protein n=1 Tax=Calcarisporiella thermophila TaxID=911321 RepID=UPI003742C02A